MAVKQYTKRPVTIEAIQYTGDNRQECVEFIGGEPKDEFIIMASWEQYQAILISTLEGTMRCDAGDWIIKGIKGEFYPCKNDIFWGSYIEQIKD